MPVEEYDVDKLPKMLLEHKYLLFYDFDIDLLNSYFEKYNFVIKISYPTYPKHIMKNVCGFFKLDKNYKDITSKSLDFMIELFKKRFAQYYNKSVDDVPIFYTDEYYADFSRDSVIIIFDNFDKIKISSYPIFEAFFNMDNVFILANAYTDEFSSRIQKLIVSNFYEVNENHNKVINVKQPFLLLISFILGIIYLAVAYIITPAYMSAFVVLGAIWIVTSWYKFENYLLKND